MAELVQHLEAEYRQSALGNWNKLKKLILKKYFSQTQAQNQAKHNVAPQNTHEALINPNGKSENSYKSRQRPPTPPLVQRTVIQVGPLSGSGSFTSQSGLGHSSTSKDGVSSKLPSKVKYSSGLVLFIFILYPNMMAYLLS